MLTAMTSATLAATARLVADLVRRVALDVRIPRVADLGVGKTSAAVTVVRARL